MKRGGMVVLFKYLCGLMSVVGALLTFMGNRYWGWDIEVLIGSAFVFLFILAGLVVPALPRDAYCCESDKGSRGTESALADVHELHSDKTKLCGRCATYPSTPRSFEWGDKQLERVEFGPLRF